MNEDKMRNDYLYNSYSDDEQFQQTGGQLKPKYEIEVEDLTKQGEVEELIHYLSNLKDDPDYNKLAQMKNKRMSKGQLGEMLKKDPGGTYIIKDGKRISLAQYMKNKNSQNTKSNFGYQPSKGNNPYDSKSASQKNPADVQAMIQNQKKVK